MSAKIEEKADRAESIAKLTPIETVALVSVVKEAAEKKAKKELTVGTHEVDILYRVTGTVTRGEDYNQQIVMKVPWIDVAAVLFGKLNGVTLKSVLEEALADDFKANEFKAAAEAAIVELKGTTDTSCNGKISTKLTAEVVNGASGPRLVE